MCTFHQENEKSPFIKNSLCCQKTEKGFITVTNNKVKITENEKIEEKEIKD